MPDTNRDGTWSTLSPAGHDCDVFQPAVPRDVPAVVLYLHGSGVERLREQPALVEQLARRRLAAAAPLAGRCWWADRVCADFDPQLTPTRHLLDNILPLIEQQFAAGPPQIALLGVGMGGQGVLRLAYRYPDIFPVVAAIAPSIDHQIYYDDDPHLQQMYAEPEAVRQDTATLHIHPLNWPRQQFFCARPGDYWWWESADRLRMKLWSLGVPHECELETDSSDGTADAYVTTMADRAFDFLVAGLEKESRR